LPKNKSVDVSCDTLVSTIFSRKIKANQQFEGSFLF
jgi:hypothetical protein